MQIGTLRKGLRRGFGRGCLTKNFKELLRENMEEEISREEQGSEYSANWSAVEKSLIEMLSGIFFHSLLFSYLDYFSVKSRIMTGVCQTQQILSAL